MKPRELHGYTEEQKNLINEIFEYGAELTSDVYEDTMYVEIATYDYNNDIYYFRIVNGKVVTFRKLSR